MIKDGGGSFEITENNGRGARKGISALRLDIWSICDKILRKEGEISMEKTRVIMHGCNGAMGQVISRLAAQDEAVEIVAGIDIEDKGLYEYPVFTAAGECDIEADVVVDFSVAKAVDCLLAFVKERKLPLVLCTTGLSKEQLDTVGALSLEIPILRSANMSLGVNTLFKLVAAAAQVLANSGYDMEIVEKHHRKKLDAPSGTALAIADAMNEALDNAYTYKLDRSSERAPRGDKEIGIQALRGGTIVGEHEVFFCGEDEVVEIKHTAYSKAIFLKNQAPGMYNMADVIG